MTEREQQIAAFRRMYSGAWMAPVLKRNSGYDVDGSSRIGYDDIMAERYIVRCDRNFPQTGEYWSGEDGPIVAQYGTIEELVDDGWRLD